MKNSALWIALASALAVTGCDNQPQPTVVDVAAADPRFSTLVAAIQKAGLATTLRGPGPFTVFAPTDDAFAALKSAGIDATQLDGATLTAVLSLHVVAGEQGSTMVAASDPQTTLGGTVDVSSRDGGLYLNGLTRIVATDVKASNGVIHVIDSVLLPDTRALDLVGIALAYPALSSLAGAVVKAELATALKANGPFTLFAPTNAAFAKLAAAPSDAQLASILKYHVLDGAIDSSTALAVARATPPGNSVPTLLDGRSVTLTLNGTNLDIDRSVVTFTDIKAKNGLIHLIDSVLIPQ